MPTPEEQDSLTLAHGIAEAAGYASLEAYAAERIDWRETRNDHPTARYVVHHEPLDPHQKIVLEGLKIEGKLLPSIGYYGKDYLAGPAIVAAIEQQQVAAIQAERAALRNRAYETMYYSDHESLRDYAAVEIPWLHEVATLSSPAKFIAPHERLSEAQHAVLETLKEEGLVARVSSGYYANDYIARDDFVPLLEQMAANVQEATHAQRLQRRSDRTQDQGRS